MSEINHVTLLRYKLRESLGDKADKYFEILKDWFRMKISKDEFDYQCRAIMPNECSWLHNEFIMTLLRRCQLLVEEENQGYRPPQVLTVQPHRTRSEERRKRQRNRDRGVFEAVDLADYVNTPINMYPPTPPGEMTSPLAPLTQEAFLPDASTLMGRFYLASWEHGLDGAEDAAAHYLSVALKTFLKSILTSIFQQRSGFRVKDKRFVYGIGNPVPNPWLKNYANLENSLQDTRVVAMEEKRARPSVEDAEQRAAYELACATSQRSISCVEKKPVSLSELHTALSLHRTTICSHHVYTLTMERIISRLHHSSHEDIHAP